MWKNVQTNQLYLLVFQVTDSDGISLVGECFNKFPVIVGETKFDIEFSFVEFFPVRIIYRDQLIVVVFGLLRLMDILQGIKLLYLAY